VKIAKRAVWGTSCGRYYEPTCGNVEWPQKGCSVLYASTTRAALRDVHSIACHGDRHHSSRSLKKLIVTQLVKEFPTFFMETEGSLPCSQQPVTDPYQPDVSSLHFPTLFPYIFRVVSSLQVFPIKILYTRAV